MFPWLAPLASKFDNFNVVRIHLEYVPAVGVVTPGQVAMYIDPEPNNWASYPSTVGATMQNYNAVCGPVYGRLTTRPFTQNSSKMYLNLASN